MAKYVYPAVFSQEGETILVDFPDFDSCYTEGADLIDAIEMGQDVLCLTLYCMEEGMATPPASSDITTMQIPANSFATLIACDTDEYRHYYQAASVKGHTHA